MLASIKKHFTYPFILLIVVVALFAVNYTPSTYLIGWDNVQTELNPLLGIKRAFFGVWQEYQNFGLVGGMGHAADLVRAVFIWLLSFIVPNSLIRYFFHFLMLFLGGLGMYVLCLATLGEPMRSPPGSPQFKKYGLVGAVLYMLNLGTVQIFHLPFEAFSVFFAALPWMVWVYIRVIGEEEENSGKLGKWGKLGVVNILATPAFYVQTLFLVYMMVLAAITLGSLGRGRIKVTIARSIVAIIIILLINSFWILPQLYFLKIGGARVVTESTINRLATGDIIHQNLEKGDIKSFLTLEGFYYELENNGTRLFQSWQDHFGKPAVNATRYIIIAIAGLGILVKSRLRRAMLLILLIVMVALLGMTPPFAGISTFIRQNELLGQIFRTPFTKFSTVYALVLSYFFAQGLGWLASLVARLHKKIEIGIYLIAVVLLIIYTRPAFSGNFISPAMRVAIPNQYFELFDYFKTNVASQYSSNEDAAQGSVAQNNKRNDFGTLPKDTTARIALLPEHTFWSWYNYTWGYNGSGFLWYGIENPMISRTFDVWNEQGESYYWQVKRALESEDALLFERIMDKYEIDYIVYDYTQNPIAGSPKMMQYDRIDELLLKIDSVQLEKSFDNLAIFSHKKSDSLQSFKQIAPITHVTNDDRGFADYGDYISTNDPKPDAYYPFADFFYAQNSPHENWKIEENENQFTITTTIPDFSESYELAADATDLTVQVEGNTLIVTVEKEAVFAPQIETADVDYCTSIKNGAEVARDNAELTVRSSNGATACFGYIAWDLFQGDGYLARIDSKNSEGRRFYFYIQDETKNQSILETRLVADREYFVIPPHFDYGIGMSFIFHNNSYKNLLSENTLQNVVLYKLPYNDIKSIRIVRKNMDSDVMLSNEPTSLKKKHYFLYEGSLTSSDGKNSLVVLPQSYDVGWKAFKITNPPAGGSIFNNLSPYFPFIFGEEIKNHVVVNNWANGWIIKTQSEKCKTKNCDIVVIFWPQYLEFLGFGLIIVLLCVICIYWLNATFFDSSGNPPSSHIV